MKVSLAQQVEAVGFACTRQQALANGQSVRGLRGRAPEEFDLKRLQAARATLEWMREHEDAIRAFMAHGQHVRDAALDMAAEIARQEAVAAAGGPTR